MLRLLVPLMLACWTCCSAVRVDEQFAWKRLDYNWSAMPGLRGHFEREGLYVPENNFPMGFARWRDRVFVSVPRYKLGVPSTLNYFTDAGDFSAASKAPELNPYPSWSENLMPNALMKRYEYPKKYNRYDNGESDGFKWFVSVMRVAVDKCDRLWALDAGAYNMTGAKEQIYKPSLIVFNLTTDEIIERHFLSCSVVQRDSFYGHLTIDSDESNCDEAFAYVSDLGASKLVVYDFKQNKSWDVRHPFFNFEPLESHFRVNGVNVRWMDGVASVALSQSNKKDGSKKAYFHATCASHEFEVSTDVLKNETWSDSEDNFEDFKLVGDRGTGSQSSISVFDEKNEILILSQLTKNGLACWDPKKPMTAASTKLFVSDKVKFSFPADMQVDYSDGNLWVLTNRLHRYLYDSLNMDEENFRLMKIPLDDVKAACKNSNARM